MAERVCTNCRTVFTAKLPTGGWITLALGLAFMGLFVAALFSGVGLAGVLLGLVPSLICLNAASRSRRSCPECGGKDAIPSETPRGQELLRNTTSARGGAAANTEFAGPVFRPPKQPGQGRPASKQQIDFLRKNGVSEETLATLTYVEAGIMASRVKQ
jgi:hypothetical protein